MTFTTTYTYTKVRGKWQVRMWLWLLDYLGVGAWAVGGGLSLFFTYFLIRLYRTEADKIPRYDAGKREHIARTVAEVLPLHPSCGWVLQNGCAGMRLFTRHLSSLQQYSSNPQVIAASLIVDASAKRALSLVTSVRELPSWFFGLPFCSLSSPAKVKQSSSHSHVLQFTMRHQPKGTLAKMKWALHSKLACWIAKHAPFLEGYFSAPQRIKTESIERYWCSEVDRPSYVFCQPISSSLPFAWSCMYFTSLRQPGMCLVTMVLCPSHQEIESLSSLIIGHLCALREHVTMRSFKVYSHHLDASKRDDHARKSDSPVMESSNHVAAKVTEATFQEEKSLSTKNSEVVAPVNESPAPSIVASSQVSTSLEDSLDDKYLDVAQDYTNKLVAMAKEEDGWLEVGTTKNVHVTKKLPKDKNVLVNSIRGSGIVKVPPEFLMRLLKDPTHSTTLDDLLKETRIVKEISPAVALVQLLYKAVWPTSPRDICLLSISGAVDSSTWVSSGTSVVDSRINPEKGYVRADLLCGGYVINSIPDQPEWSNVVYLACINMRGNIPAFAVNKIAESQPMCVNNLRSLACPLYQQMKDDPQKMASFQEQFPIPCIFNSKKIPTPPAPSALEENDLPHANHHGDRHVQQNGSPELETERATNSGFQTPPIMDLGDEENKSTTEGGSLEPSGNSAVISGPSDDKLEEDCLAERSTPNAALMLSHYTHKEQLSDSHLQSITKENISYPRHDSGQVDYRTMANQTAARVLEEVFHVSGLDLCNSSTFTNQPTGGWSFAGLEKDVLLLSKTVPDQPFSCFMGKGIIPLSPDFVFNSLRNPQLRFMYDNMLKELHIVKHIEDGLFILHLHHETTQCFIKQARDFCILVNERCEPNKKLLTGISIETPDCPPNSALHRGKIHCSGWVVEPKTVKGKVCAEVTYLLQVDVGGVPSTLVNFISKRQPLAIAYLRDYLVSTSLEQSLEQSLHSE